MPGVGDLLSHFRRERRLKSNFLETSLRISRRLATEPKHAGNEAGRSENFSPFLS
jgi:hypothetical protein